MKNGGKGKMQAGQKDMILKNFHAGVLPLLMLCS
jgi:hypothetical protein